MSGQIALQLPRLRPTDGVVINARCLLRAAGDQRVVVVAGMPVHHYKAADKVAEAYAMVFLADSGFALQNEIAKAFGCSERTVRRHQRRYAHGGMAALATRCGWRPGRRRIAGRRLQVIRRLKVDGLSNREIARRLGVTESAIRKQVGPAEPAVQEVLPLPPREDTSKQTAEAQEQPKGHCQPEETSEPVSMSFDTEPTDRTFDRLLARMGLLDDAAPLFGEATAVRGAGVMFAIPLLIHSGIFRIAQKLYGSIGPAFYGLRTTILTLLMMALMRIKRPEALKERDPATLGRIIGLDRAPEVKTVRRKLTHLAAYHRAERLGYELAQERVEQRGSRMGFLYVDGHVRAYHGKRTLPKAFVPLRRLAMPATTDYWVGDQKGDPLFVVTAEANAGLVKMLPKVLAEVRQLVGKRRVTIVFDRGGWSPKLFGKLIKDGFDILTYRKGKTRRVCEKRFILRRAKLDGRWVKYRLHDQAVRFLKGKLRLRQVTRLTDDGHQTQVLTSRFDLRDVEVAYRMFERWHQENFFKYMREEFLLDALVDYQVEPDDPTRTVPNPERRAINKEIRAARAEVAKLEQAYGAAAADNPETSRPTIRGFKIAHGKLGKQLRAARNRLDELLARRRALPTRVEIRDVSEGAVIKLAAERKHLTNIIKMVAYQAESDLLSMLQPHYARAEQEGRTLLHELFNTSADIEVIGDELHVTLSPLSAPHRTLAAQALCEPLSEIATKFPGTNLHLRFDVHAPPRIGLAFPGPNPRNQPANANSSAQPDIS
jgi:prepilin-type processing-associated H-X9-DG protein